MDEPTALGVPPYLSPYPRLVAGVLACHDVPFDYFTVDQWRASREIKERIASLPRETLLVVVAGLTVPGHYRGGTPITLTELSNLVSRSSGQVLIGGPIRHGYTLTGGTAAVGLSLPADARVAQGDLEVALEELLEGREPGHGYRSFADLARWAVKGAAVAAAHPRFPHIIAEIESARGCERAVHCSFCTEGLYHQAEYRSLDDIVAEVEALHTAGVRHFRLGKQPNFFSWPGTRAKTGEVVPDPAAIERLYRDLRSAAPELKTLHIDNVNPGFVAAYPGQCEEIASIIAAHNTPGDVAAMGLESADPAVQSANNLKSSTADALKAIEIINRAGAHRVGNSLPALLPGVNLLFGLPGETTATYDHNYRFLMQLLDRGLLVRRINVRQVMVFPGTPLHEATGGRSPKLKKGRYKSWRRKVSEEIERPMLEKVAPVGTMLKELITEFHDGDVTFGRQLASYPLLTGLPMPVPAGEVLDAIVVGHGFRSVTALPHPIDVNSLPEKALAAIPGVGRKRARRIVAARPFAQRGQLLACLDEPAVLEPFLDDIDLPSGT